MHYWLNCWRKKIRLKAKWQKKQISFVTDCSRWSYLQAGVTAHTLVSRHLRPEISWRKNVENLKRHTSKINFFWLSLAVLRTWWNRLRLASISLVWQQFGTIDSINHDLFLWPPKLQFKIIWHKFFYKFFIQLLGGWRGLLARTCYQPFCEDFDCLNGLSSWLFSWCVS